MCGVHVKGVSHLLFIYINEDVDQEYFPKYCAREWVAYLRILKEGPRKEPEKPMKAWF